MWISSCRSPITLMTVLVIVYQLIYLTSTEDTPSSGTQANPIPMFLHSGKSLKVEVIVILPDSSNASLGFSKSLNRALNSMDDESSVGQEKREPILWRVKNFVIVNDTNSSTLDSTSSKFESLPVRRKLKKFLTISQPTSNISFSPNLVPEFCDFLEKTKPIAIVDFVGNYIGGEKILSIISSTTALPLIGSQYETKSLHKDKYDYFISLSASVRQVAQALGHFLIHCHWHTFTVIFDDSPSVSASQGVWESVLLKMKVNPRQLNETNSDITTLVPDFYDYERIAANYPEYDGNDVDEESSPGLNPKFITMQSRKLNGAIRALSHLTKLTQGVVVLICSQNSLFEIFRAAQKLRMLNGDYVFILVGHHTEFEVIPDWIPSGVLALRSPQKVQIGKHMTKKIGKLLSSALHSITNLKIHVERKQGGGRMSSSELFDEKTDFSIMDSTSSRSYPSGVAFQTQQRFKGPSKSLGMKSVQDLLNNFPNVSCWKMPSLSRIEFSHFFTSSIREKIESNRNSQDREVQTRLRDPERLALTFDILNLINSEDRQTREWTNVGNISMDHPRVNLRTIQWPGGGIFGPGDRLSKTYRIVTVTAPPFIMEAEPDDNKTCVIGLPCLKVNTTNKDELEVIFADFVRGNHESSQYKLACCDGFAMDLLTSISRELKFEMDLFLVPDGYFGELSIRTSQWNGLINVLLSGSAHMSFAPLSVTSERATAVDFSTPFFFSGVGFLGMAKTHDVPLMAFLAPFSYELWAAIFLTLNLTALAVALFEWLSPFGLNPWGRQRTKNFSIASALWVVWGRLFSHLVAFKAPKSWPNKFLINVWGGFSVIFVASYTANIAALFAGKFFQRGLDVHDRSLLSQRVATIQHSATDFYIRKESPILWDVVRRYQVHNFQEGVDMLKNGTLDLLIGDGPLLDYYRGSDSSCSLIDVSNQDKIGDDTYAVAMTKGFPLRESISVLIAKYIGNGYLDYLQGKWYGQLECFRRRTDFVRARALGVDSVAGMIIMLGLGTLVGILILGMELIVYKYALPYFRSQPKGTLWRSPNIMFFSQKLYRFINCVELVSPHHAAKELVKTLKQGQITSLFQKSVKRKEHEQRRRRRSKAQFFEMIQEIRRVQKREKQQKTDVAETNFASTSSSAAAPIYSIQARLERNKQTPKVVRILGVETETIHEAPEPEEVSEEKASSSRSLSPPPPGPDRRSPNNADEIHMHVFYV